jgi:anti-anti-sigma factor
VLVVTILWNTSVRLTSRDAGCRCCAGVLVRIVGAGLISEDRSATSRFWILRVGGSYVSDGLEPAGLAVGDGDPQLRNELLVGQVRERLAECEGSASEELMVGLWRPWDGLCVVALRGEMDMNNAAAVRRAVDGRIGADSCDLIVELSQLTFMDSSGIDELVSLSRTLDTEGGMIVLAAPTAAVARLFATVKLGDGFVISESLEDALTHISATAALPARATK